MDGNEQYSFGAWVRRCRKALNLTQGELAHKVGCAGSTIRKIESDERRPSWRIAVLLARVLEIPAPEQSVFLAAARTERTADAPAPLAQRAPVMPEAGQDANPFFHRGPVRDPAYFFGRKQSSATAIELISHGQSVALHGQRRFGKTSLLFHLAHAQATGAMLWAYLDGGMLDGLEATWLYGAIDQALGGREDSIPYPRLVERLRELQSRGQRLVVAIDEFELLAANPLLGLSVFNRLRGLAATLPIQYVTASKRPLLDLTFAHADTLSSPFFNIFAPLQIGLFSDEDANTLMAVLSERGGRPFPPQTRAFLLDLVGPHPLFVQIAAYHAYAVRASGALDAAALDQIRQRTIADLESHLRYYWADLEPAAQYRLATIPLGGPPDETLHATGLVRHNRYPGVLIEAFVRRQPVDGVFQRGSLLLDMKRGLAATRDGPVHLTPTERAALQVFLERAGEVITPEELEAALWPGEDVLDPERARGVVKKLRSALGVAGEAIVNRRGHGYLLDVDS